MRYAAGDCAARRAWFSGLADRRGRKAAKSGLPHGEPIALARFVMLTQYYNLVQAQLKLASTGVSQAGRDQALLISIAGTHRLI